MLLDGRSVSTGSALRTDVCIVGAGAAGLTIAQELARQRMRVLVVESGGRAIRPSTQRLYDGEISGHPYYPLAGCRFRVLGGTTHLWGGWCRPLDALDFEKRDWVADSGWPFEKRDLDRMYERAQVVCRLGAYDYRPRRDPCGPCGIVSSRGEEFEDTIFRIRPTRFGEEYAPALRESRTADLLLNANALEIGMDRTGRMAGTLRAATARGNHFSIGADVFVLASGGIENARLLLCSRERSPRGIGNDHDLVGRYFSDHLHVPVGRLRMDDRLSDFYWTHRRDSTTVRGAISLTEQCRRRERALGFAVTLHNADDPHDVFSLAQRAPSHLSLHSLVYACQHRQPPDRVLHHLRNVATHVPEVCNLVYRRYVKPRRRTLLVGCRAEQVPHRDSRVTLTEARDSFGVPRVRLDWRVSQQDLDSLRHGVGLLTDALDRQSLHMVPLPISNGSDVEWSIAGGAHHMGTTRMHRDPRSGVVNENCRVHGTDNLYVAGPSVFPTGGWAPPVLTVVALALRLADHLATSAAQGHP